MISIKDYAKQNHITYEAVRQQIKRYREQLDDHIILDGRTQYLDDIAVAFLDERRQKNPVVVYQQNKDEEIEQLKNEVARLLRRQEGLRDRIDELSKYKELAEGERRALEESKAAQDRREQELAQREEQMAQELAEAAQKAAEDARAAEEAKYTKKLTEAQEAAQKELTAVQEKAAAELAEKDRKIQELENRTFGDYLKGLFRRKEK